MIHLGRQLNEEETCWIIQAMPTGWLVWALNHMGVALSSTPPLLQSTVCPGLIVDLLIMLCTFRLACGGPVDRRGSPMVHRDDESATARGMANGDVRWTNDS